MLSLEELKKLSLKELDQEFAKATKDLFKIRFEVNTGSSKASHQIRNLKKYRANIKTVRKDIEASEQKKFTDQKVVEEPKTEKKEEEKAEKAKK
ncbi:50S ribosomal protein L29 [Patescibacteria group bacterium]